MTESVAKILPYLVLISHAVFAVLVFALLFRHSWGKKIFAILADRALVWGLVISIVAIVGSLFYSETIGFEPCVLCWWQRVFLYPQAVIFAMAIWKKDKSAFLYAVPLALISLALSFYQVFANASGFSLLSCTSLEGSCSKIYVRELGYITIPVMSLTVSLFILLVAAAARIRNNNENSNA